MAVPDTIDPRAINKAKNGKITIFKKHENLTLAINSAKVDFLISFDLPGSTGLQTISSMRYCSIYFLFPNI